MSIVVPEAVLAQQKHHVPVIIAVPAYLAGCAVGSVLGGALGIAERIHHDLTRPHYTVKRR